MTPTLAASVARTLDADPALLPVIDELLAGMDELGTSSDEIVDLVRSAGLPPNASVLDLGCGRGAVAVALATRFGLRVHGIDALPPFIDDARRRAAVAGVAHLCTFESGDLREALEEPAAWDLVSLIGLGDVLGDHACTVEKLRGQVRPGGYMLIADGFLGDHVQKAPSGYEGYAGRAETYRRLLAHGDQLIRELVTPSERLVAIYRADIELYRARAGQIAAEQPELADALARFIELQERETEIADQQLVDAAWLLRRGG